jgi:hypothetical protein
MTLTYPRSGSHYLRDLVKQKLDTDLNDSHNWDDAKGFVITIARNPYDSIQSVITMTMHYEQPVEIDKMIRAYNHSYGFLYTRANVVIDYNTLTNNPNKVISYLSDILEKPINPDEYRNEMTDHPDKKYLVSSTTSELYKENYLSGFELKDSFRAYHLLLSRKSF